MLASVRSALASHPRAAAALAALCGSISGLWFGVWVGVAAGLRLRLSPPAHEIETHIRETQPPANLLGIGVAEVDEGSLALHAPLELNHNVHGTAFAGSLYSLELVAKAGSISYRRPLKGERIIARSQLPAEAALRDCQIGGMVLGDADGKPACEYSIEAAVASKVVADRAAAGAHGPEGREGVEDLAEPAQALWTHFRHLL
ncbi:hypothetical protein EMIHUDRAFT_217177 [Emiliania huxleyi CCMP1516]|uniref:Thioesterase putative domain-containing protein n=2 Tax=Emiliania huxleyi TaxID=2903 RepID=A0A0D3IC84_EMIH1|nr:hypothetical protein EMIHUDRAFT_217177 [Emiliania huxleyi CCMP1516]EOD08869.1 hypothetical protein EMIHUDRAFT_217177 [Emiliania huxleyi CCMP1516]|eukprot:XP_005761298.1 hypothetical protein EMIHUDRAFT_217177 [Emiliania huxleyi CCMP1516]